MEKYSLFSFLFLSSTKVLQGHKDVAIFYQIKYVFTSPKYRANE